MGNSSKNPQYRNRDWLVEKYHGDRMGFKKLADHAGVAVATIQYWMDKHDIDSRPQGQPTSLEVSLVQDKRGYERWYNQHRGDKFTCYVHQLVAIADGYDPDEVFDTSTEIHHQNGIKWDNRPSNIILLSRDDHQEIHRDDYVSPWE